MPLELDIDTSALVGQRVMVKYVAGGAASTTGASPVLIRTEKPSQASPISVEDEHKSAAENKSAQTKDVDGRQQLSTYWYLCAITYIMCTIHIQSSISISLCVFP